MFHFEKNIKILILLITALAYTACDNVNFSKASDPVGKTSFEVGAAGDVEDPTNVDGDNPGGPNNPPVEPPMNPPPIIPDVPNNFKTGCRNVNVSNIVVNVNAVYTKPNSDFELVTTHIGQIDLLTNQPLFIMDNIPADMDPNLVRLQLAAEGNYIVDGKGDTHPLKTPSAQQSGLKVQTRNLDGILEKGESYLIRFNINPLKQLAGNKKKCILKPVIHDAEIKNTRDEF